MHDFLQFILYVESEDYVLPSDDYALVVFPSGHKISSLDVNLIDDNIIEKNGTFRVTIVNISLPFGVFFGKFSSAEVTISSKFVKYVYICNMFMDGILSKK